MSSIRKSAGPEFRKQARPLKKCPDCNGTGMVKGVFYEMVCPGCECSRVVDAETGELLSYDELAFSLWKKVDQLKDQIAERNRQEKELYSNVGHGPMGQRYHGD